MMQLEFLCDGPDRCLLITHYDPLQLLAVSISLQTRLTCTLMYRTCPVTLTSETVDLEMFRSTEIMLTDF